MNRVLAEMIAWRDFMNSVLAARNDAFTKMQHMDGDFRRDFIDESFNLAMSIFGLNVAIENLEKHLKIITIKKQNDENDQYHD